jgi:hypothetical protein
MSTPTGKLSEATKTVPKVPVLVSGTRYLNARNIQAIICHFIFYEATTITTWISISYRITMIKQLDYNAISLVIESWEALRRIKNYEEVAGTILFKR